MRIWFVLLLCTRVATADELSDEQLYRCKTGVAEVEVTFKPETDLKDLVTWAMGFTCKHFGFDPRIVQTGKKVTLMVPNRITPREAYQTFLFALATMGLTVVPDGNMLRVVESSTAKHDHVPIVHKDLPDTGDQIVRFVYKPTHAAPDVVQATFASTKSDVGDIQVAGPWLVITDYASHVRDMMSLAKLVDVPGGSDAIYAMPLKHASAPQLVQEIAPLLGKDPKLLVDERTNTLLFAGSEAAYRRIRALVDTIDIAVETESGATFHVYPLGAAVAEELAKTLNDAISGTAQPTGKAAVDNLGSALQGKVKVIADGKTNKLLVVSSGRDYLAVRDVIKQLDEPRRQVFIEAMILEVELDRSLDFGASAHFGDTTNDGKGSIVGGVQMPSLRSTDLSTLAGANGLLGGLIGPLSDSLFGKSIPSYGVLVQALATRSNSNILSLPSIIALDNEEAKSKVGVDIPYKRGIVPTTPFSTTSTVTTNIDRKPLVLELDIKPHISTDDGVLLEIKYESQDRGDDLGELGPTWTVRSYETRAVVHDQSTVVLGGLVQEHESVTTTQVPLLGDIPILGHLFKYTSRAKKKTNLLIMLTPYIVKDALDLEALRARKMREHDEFVRSFRVLDRLPYRPRVDYRRKRGVVEEINRAIVSVEDDVAARNALHAPDGVKAGAVE